MIIRDFRPSARYFFINGEEQPFLQSVGTQRFRGGDCAAMIPLRHMRHGRK
jgi:hypothetical protein